MNAIIQTVQFYILLTGLIGWWPFIVNANDVSINGNNWTVVGAILTNDRNGNPNSAFNLNSEFN